MDDFLEKRNAKRSAGEHGGAVSADFAKYYPLLANCLNGMRDKDGSELLPQFSLTMWANEGGIDFVLRQKGDRAKKLESWFGTCGESADALAAVNLAVGEGRYRIKLEAGAKF
jgi:hypothetical protein